MSRDTLIGLGLSAMARDNADPDKVVAAARAAFISDAAPAAEKDPILEAKDAEIADLKAKLAAKDAEDEEEKKKKEAEAKDAEDLASKLAALDSDDEEDDDDEEEKERKRKKKAEAEDAGFIQPFGEEAVAPSERVIRLRELRPLIARSNDAKLKAQFDKLARKANDAIKGETPVDSYAQVRAAAATPSAGAQDAAMSYAARLNARAQARSRGEEVK